ncbi:DMT family transporter [Comamonas aquatica]|jgi:drug/metabolite transporter (DMT)-like permease|uniref:DMT family transporter n=1 Tax=Comamonas aquatica TaxID=225991 RepID=UPI0021B0BBE0|nr:DMT family transporter [Comamonas aquatica]
MPGFHTAVLTVLAMLAFAANSLLCRLALQSHAIDAASFTAVRLVSGALVLALVVRLRALPAAAGRGRWGSAAWLFVYAAAFSLAYLQLPAGVGALLLFGAVQATMVGVGLWRGERLALHQWAGLVLALGGLVVLLRPGLSAPPWGAAGLMLLAGVAWGAYSLRGKGAKDPVGVTAGNFLRAASLALLMWGLMAGHASVSVAGLASALCSGALTSGLGYVAWYAALPQLKAGTAASVQLSVPLLAAIGAVLLLGESWTLRLSLAGAAILGGIALVVLARPGPPPAVTVAPGRQP